MKKQLAGLLFSLSLLASCGATSGNIANALPPVVYTYYTVTFDSLGGSEIPSVSVIEGNPIPEPEVPTLDGYSFTGWYKEQTISEDNLWHFNIDRVNSDLTLYAGYQSIEVIEPTASLTYALEGGSYTVTGVGYETVIVIPSTYNGLPVTKIQAPYGNGAFARTNITEVTIPDSIIEIGQNSFNNCVDLTRVNISPTSNLQTIGNNAFSGNTSLESFYLPASVTTLGSSVFNNCENIVFEVSEDNEKYISTNGHLIDTSTNTLIRATNNPVIPEGVVNIENAAFRRSTIDHIEIPSTLQKIGRFAFSDTNLTRIDLDPNNHYFNYIDGILFSGDNKTVVLTPTILSGIIRLPSQLTSIPSSIFAFQDQITDVYIPLSVTSIGYRSFYETNLIIHYAGSEDDWEEVSVNSLWGANNLEFHFNSTYSEN